MNHPETATPKKTTWIATNFDAQQPVEARNSARYYLAMKQQHGKINILSSNPDILGDARMKFYGNLGYKNSYNSFKADHIKHISTIIILGAYILN